MNWDDTPSVSSGRFILIKRGVRIVVNTRDPREHDFKMRAEAFEAVIRLQSIRVTVLYTDLLHRKLAILDETISYEGSLNILSQSYSAEIMRRSDNIAYCAQLVEFIGLTAAMIPPSKTH